MATVGEALIALLEAHGVDTVFGIPGVHTVELYRGLARSRIRHVTPRHEQGAAFMADGYARACGKPGVAFVITGPGLTNTITAMAQARADSVPMLVISGVNATPTLGKGLGFLHELPDQRGMMEKVALSSRRITAAGQLPGVIAGAFEMFATARPGPVRCRVPGPGAGEKLIVDRARSARGRCSAQHVRRKPLRTSKTKRPPMRTSTDQAAGAVGDAMGVAGRHDGMQRLERGLVHVVYEDIRCVYGTGLTAPQVLRCRG